MTISYENSKQIIEIYDYWDKFSMLNLHHWHDAFDNDARGINNNSTRVDNWPEEERFYFCWKFHPQAILDNLETDKKEVAEALYHSLSTSDEQKLYLKMKWAFK